MLNAPVSRPKDEHAKKESAASDRDPLHFVERDFIAGAVVEFRRARDVGAPVNVATGMAAFVSPKR
jgi:hypothetical protein